MTPSRPAALIVEDQPFVGLVASDILRESGFDTFHAYDAKDAAAVLQEHPEIELVVTEAELPGDETGLELCRRVSQERPDVQLVVTSAGREFRPTELPQGARTLRKPYASGELKTLVAAKTLIVEA
jgi:two-component system, response regulator PdtaR